MSSKLLYTTVPALQKMEIAHGFGLRGIAVADMVAAADVAPVAQPRLQQIHGAQIHVATQKGATMFAGDAIITAEPQVVCAVATADCVPVLLWDPRHQVVGAIHAGWRGVAADIVPLTVQKIWRQWGDSSQDMILVLGPSMAASCYEVGMEVVTACARTVPDIAPFCQPTRPDHVRIDLHGVIRAQLTQLGIPASHIISDSTCTHCTSHYSSFRRDHDRERQFSWIVRC